MKSSKPVQMKAKSRLVIIPVTSLEMFLSTRRGIMPGRVEGKATQYKRRPKWGQRED